LIRLAKEKTLVVSVKSSVPAG